MKHFKFTRDLFDLRRKVYPMTDNIFANVLEFTNDLSEFTIPLTIDEMDEVTESMVTTATVPMIGIVRFEVLGCEITVQSRGVESPKAAHVAKLIQEMLRGAE